MAHVYTLQILRKENSQPKCMVDKEVENRISRVPKYEKIMKAFKYFVKLPWGYFAWGAL